MIMSNFLKKIVTLGPIGYVKASGTIASAVSLPWIVIIFNLKLTLVQSSIIIIGITLCSLLFINAVMPLFAYEDSPHIVIDEVVGMFYTFWGLKLNLSTLFMGFVFFRLFDITKILGIRYVEKNIPNPIAIIIDDIVAGLLANSLVRILCNMKIL